MFFWQISLFFATFESAFIFFIHHVPKYAHLLLL